jgi:uncharacterized protein YgbK (DUF1537 family)
MPTLYIVDDDPTGAQGQANVPILLTWSPALLRAVRDEAPRAVHLLTNGRALDEASAYDVVRDAATAVRAVEDAPWMVLRGDSTLRAHLLPEYLALRDALGLGAGLPLLLVPALPQAGRVTVGGRHWLVREGVRVPIAETEFAADPRFGYRASRLVDWAQERSGGHFRADRGIELGLDEVRAGDGALRVAAALTAAARASVASVVVPDAETHADLAVIAAGLRHAWQDGAAVAVRCAPAFAGILSGAAAQTTAPPPPVRRGLLVAVGSHVPTSSAQLTALDAAHPGRVVELEPAALAGDTPVSAGAVQRAAAQARRLLEDGGLAVVATSRALDPACTGPEAGMQIAHGLANVVHRLRDASDVLLSKGGITSAVNVRDGLEAERAQVVGPVAPGVSLWHVTADDGTLRPVIVFPGNVGDPEALARLVDELLAS